MARLHLVKTQTSTSFTPNRRTHTNTSLSIYLSIYKRTFQSISMYKGLYWSVKNVNRWINDTGYLSFVALDSVDPSTLFWWAKNRWRANKPQIPMSNIPQVLTSEFFLPQDQVPSKLKNIPVFLSVLFIAGCEGRWIHAFSKGINSKWKANGLVQDLILVRRVHFLIRITVTPFFLSLSLSLSLSLLNT